MALPKVSQSTCTSEINSVRQTTRVFLGPFWRYTRGRWNMLIQHVIAVVPRTSQCLRNDSFVAAPRLCRVRCFKLYSESVNILVAKCPCRVVGRALRKSLTLQIPSRAMFPSVHQCCLGRMRKVRNLVCVLGFVQSTRKRFVCFPKRCKFCIISEESQWRSFSMFTFPCPSVAAP